MSNVHMTRLADWAVQQFGKALLISMAGAAAIAMVAFAVEEPGFVAFAYIAGPALFGGVLMSAKAPLPYGVLDDIEGDDGAAD